MEYNPLETKLTNLLCSIIFGGTVLIGTIYIVLLSRTCENETVDASVSCVVPNQI